MVHDGFISHCVSYIKLSEKPLIFVLFICVQVTDEVDEISVEEFHKLEDKLKEGK